MLFDQKERPFALTDPFGDDTLVLASATGHEGVSIPFAFDCDLRSLRSDIEGKDVIGTKATLRLDIQGGEKRYVTGIALSLDRTGTDDGVSAYRLTIVSPLTLLQYRTNSRIFQERTVPEILEEVLADMGSPVTFNLARSYSTRNYCVQYRETDFDFVSRLMEEEGIFYYFSHTASDCTMVVGDSPEAHLDSIEKNIAYKSTSGGDHVGMKISAWTDSQTLHSGKIAKRDFHFQMPSNEISSTTSTLVDLAGNSDLELYDYPSGAAKRFDEATGGLGQINSEIDLITQLRMEERESAARRYRGESDCRQLIPGHTFTLEEHPLSSGDFVVVAMHHVFSNNLDEHDVAHYQNSFECIAKSDVFRPPMVTAKPIVHGCQTAKVIGDAGEEIFTDQFGRIKVCFPWERLDKDSPCSCWVRAAMPWAGNQWGMIALPRVGDEVLVDFVEGDPDQPIVVGSVYNADQMPPYKLPDNQTQSGIKTRSTPDGGAENFNELRFEDKKGKEQIYVHAEKDFQRVVENDEKIEIGHDQSIDVKNARTEVVQDGDETITIKKGNRTVNIEKGDETLNVKTGDQTTTVDMGNQSHNIKMGDASMKVDMGNHDLTIKMGNQTTKIDLGKSSTSAMQSIELKVGGNSIKIDQTGITLKGIMVKIEGQAMTEVKGTIAKVEGAAMLQAKGGITMIG